jgi:hypothetical protein
MQAYELLSDLRVIPACFWVGTCVFQKRPQLKLDLCYGHILPARLTT